MTERLLTVAEAGTYLGGVSRATVYREVQRGKLTLTKVRGSSFVSRTELDRYLKAAERVAA